MVDYRVSKDFAKFEARKQATYPNFLSAYDEYICAISDNNRLKLLRMNVIRPETLQRLVELKAKQPGSIDLLQLKPCLEQQPFGEEADAKVNRYIDDVREKLKVRSYIVQLVKDFLERTKSESVEFNQLHGAYAFSMSPQPLNYEAMHEILVELSSPLTGYLGRIKGESLGRDRFYFLRDLLLDD